MTAPATESPALSPECTLARQPGYSNAHQQCRRTEDIPLPHSHGILLQRRCGCTCHRWNRATS